MIIVVLIGCLECGNESDLLGVYPDEATARTAHPDMEMRDSVDAWWGDRMTVGFSFDA